MFEFLRLAPFLTLIVAFPISVQSADPSPDPQRIALSTAERQWIAANPVIRVAPDPAYQPIESLNDSGRLVGMSADYLKLLEGFTGLRFRVSNPGNWDGAMKMAKNRDIDMLSAATKTDARAQFMSFTSPHIELPGVIITRRGGEEFASMEALRGKTIGIVSGYVWQEWVATDYPDIKILPVTNMEAGLLLTSFGQIDAMIGNLATATQTLHELGISNLLVSGKTGYAARLAIASRKDWPVLASILEKAVTSISEKDRRAILSRYITFNSDAKSNRRVLFLTIMATIAIILVMTAAAVAWNYSLRRIVRQQNTDLRESSERYRAIVEDQTELISRSLPNSHRLTFVNEAYCTHYGRSRNELLGGSFLNFAPAEERREIITHIGSLDRKNPMARSENRIVSADGKISWLQWSNRAIFDDNGKVVEIQSVGRDITENRRVAAALLAAKNEAELASQSKSEFLANMSHELRTPLNAIIGFSEIITRELLGPLGNAKYRGYGENILSSGNHLLGLISDILDVTKIETGAADFFSEDIDLKDAINTAHLMTKDDASTKGVNLIQQLPDDSSLPYRGDRRRLIQILVNLVSNAIKFTGVGGTVTVEVLRDMESGYILTVADTGIGISAENIPKIFERFSRIEEAETRGAEGIGLGLPLTKILVELHGGQIKIDSEPGIGTIVTAWLPGNRIAKSA
jgi:two-component system, sensor histidine kinase and response regulator